MKTINYAALLAAVFVAVAGCAPNAPDTAADAAAIKADAPVWFDLYNAGDADGVAALYADDGVVMAPGTPAVVGRAAIRDYIESDIETSKAAGLTFKGDEVTEGAVDGDTAWTKGGFSVVDASGAQVSTGKFLTVYRRTSGQWLILRDIWIADMSVTPASPLADTFIEVWNTREYDKLDSIMTADFRRVAPDQSADGLAAMKEFMAQVHATYPDFQIRIDESAYQEGVGFLLWTATGTNTGEGTAPPTGNSIDVSGISMLRFADGKIAVEVVHYDTATLMEQLGTSAIPHAEN
jgi:steroid delta-isomerase-like uncharacterized protein/uncharacterized protein (TIGR02246 family)